MKLLKTNLIILACGLLFPHAMMAQNISGVGYAPTQTQAKKEALADLSQVIKSEVRTNFESTQTNNGEDAKSNIKISSNLPILGAEFKLDTYPKNQKVLVYIDSQRVKTLYEKKLSQLKREINSLQKELKKAKQNSLKITIYEDMYSLLNEYDRYESVARILGAKEQQRANITKATVKVKLSQMKSDIDSIKMACGILAKRFKEKKVFIYPPLLQHTTTASQFSSVFQKELMGKMSNVKDPKNAKYILVGEYTLTNKGMVLNYELLSTRTNEVKKSKTITLKSSAYDGLKTSPANIDFDALLNSGIVSSSDLKVQINSNRGSENLLFREGEEVELFVKLNKMGYIYIVGYTQTEAGKFSYLLELTQGQGDSRFTMFINADDANRWMSLGGFSVEKPFGVESLQVFASDKKFTKLPNTYEKDGYYVISNEIKKTLSQTRGLKKIKSKKAQTDESVMSFTTVK